MCDEPAELLGQLTLQLVLLPQELFHLMKAVAMLLLEAGVGGVDLIEGVELHVDGLVLLLQPVHVRSGLRPNLINQGSENNQSISQVQKII